MYSIQLSSAYIPSKFASVSSKSASFGDSSDSSDEESLTEKNCSPSRLFVIDTKPEVVHAKSNYTSKVEHLNSKVKEMEQSTRNINQPNYSSSNTNKSKQRSLEIKLSSQIQSGIDTEDTYIKMKAKDNLSLPKFVVPITNQMAKSALQAGYEQQHSVPEYSEGRRQLKRARMVEKAKTRGAEWFHLPATELTEELKNDLTVLQMRRAMDPKHFYKKNDPLPKYFQVGTVIESAADFYHSRVPKKDRKRTLVEELLHDAEFKKYGKKKYNEIINKQPKWKRSSKKRRKAK